MKIKKKYVYAGAIILLIVIAGLLYLKPFKKGQIEQPLQNASFEWRVNEEGYLSYPLDREAVKFSRADYMRNESLLVSKIIYQSRGANIYGFLAIPTFAEKLVPGIVLLPGAGVSKESELELAVKIAQLGAAVLVIDQRGVGETDGYFPTIDEDYRSFLAGEEPVQHLMVYDALRAYDLLNNAPFVDSDNIAIAGESLGGRIAIIAAALDRNIKGALVISSAGFDFKGGPDAKKNQFLESIDADHYIGRITPRKLVMIHSINDTTVPLSAAARTFDNAEEPKRFALVNDTGCSHGYCEEMDGIFPEALDFLVDLKSRTVAEFPVNSTI